VPAVVFHRSRAELGWPVWIALAAGCASLIATGRVLRSRLSAHRRQRRPPACQHFFFLRGEISLRGIDLDSRATAWCGPMSIIEREGRGCDGFHLHANRLPWLGRPGFELQRHPDLLIRRRRVVGLSGAITRFGFDLVSGALRPGGHKHAGKTNLVVVAERAGQFSSASGVTTASAGRHSY